MIGLGWIVLLAIAPWGALALVAAVAIRSGPLYLSLGVPAPPRAEPELELELEPLDPLPMPSGDRLPLPKIRRRRVTDGEGPTGPTVTP